LKGLTSAVAAAVFTPFKKDKNTPVNSKNKEDTEPFIARLVLTVVLSLVQVPVLAIVLCPVVLYVLGLYLSAGISLWRPIPHDYGNTDGGGNLKPALNVL
jgi:hypothetical protein